MQVFRLAGEALDAARPVVLAFALRIILGVALTLAAPFFAFAILFALLEKAWPWIAIPAAMGALVLVAGLAAWLWVRSLLRKAREHVARAAEAEGAVFVDVLP